MVIMGSSLRKGISLIEIILSIALIGLIASFLLPMFIISTKIDSSINNKLHSTYIGQNTIEATYQRLRNKTYADVEKELIQLGYKKSPGNTYNLIDNNKYLIELEIEDLGDLYRVSIRVYSDLEKKILSSQFEEILAKIK
jgi:type II secretory pathway pseudopilin PulG